MFHLPTSGSSGDDQDGLSSAVAKTTSVSDTSTSDKRQCDPSVGVDRKKPLSKTPLSLVAIEFLLDQQRSFLPSSRLQPFQVGSHSLSILPLRWPVDPSCHKNSSALCVCLSQHVMAPALFCSPAKDGPKRGSPKVPSSTSSPTFSNILLPFCLLFSFY